MQGGKSFRHPRTILPVSDTKPPGFRFQNIDRGILPADHFGNRRGNVKFGLRIAGVNAEKFRELRLEQRENLHGEPPEVHGYRFVIGEKMALGGTDYATGISFQTRALGDRLQTPAGDCFTDSTRNRAMLGECFVQPVGDNGKGRHGPALRGGSLSQELRQNQKASAP